MNAHAPLNEPPLVDPFGRAIAYVRVSVTDRCDFRCVYCMSEDMSFLPKRDVLSLEEMDRLCSAFVSLGARKIRAHRGRTPGQAQCDVAVSLALAPSGERARSTK